MQLDVEKFRAEQSKEEKIKERNNYEEDEIVGRLSNIYSFDNEQDVTKYILEIIPKIKEGNFTIQAYCNIFKSLIWFQQLFVNNSSIASYEFLNICETGIMKTINNGNILDMDYQLGDLYSEHEFGEFGKLTQFIQERLDNHNNGENAKRFVDLLNLIRENESDKVRETVSNSELFTFQAYAADRVLDALKKAKPITIHSFGEGLTLRYKNDGNIISSVPRYEEVFICTLSQLLDNLNEPLDNLVKLTLNELNSYLKDIIKKNNLKLSSHES